MSSKHLMNGRRIYLTLNRKAFQPVDENTAGMSVAVYAGEEDVDMARRLESWLESRATRMVPRDVRG